MENIIVGNLRIQVLDKNLIRIEKKYLNNFIDSNTFLIPNRTNYEGYKYELTNENEYTIITVNQYKLYIPNDSKYSKIHLKDRNDKTIYRFKKIENSGELPRIFDTPTVFALNDAPHIIIPNEGYSIKSFKDGNKGYQVLENDFDIYLFIIEKDYRLLRQMYVELTGRVNLVRLQTLGLWNSRYYKYKDKEVYKLIDKYKKYNIPLDNFVIDTDWRKANDIGIGYEIDTKLFPNMKNVFDYAHERNVSIMFNDHPEPFEKVHNVFEYEEIEFREKNLRKLLELGLDTWWYDRNWSTKLISPTKRIEPETMGLYLFNDITKKHYQNRDGNYYTRPDIMGNVNNILNGMYVKINDSASHRYPIQWTGDNTSIESDLSLEVKNLILGSENEISYINFDVGGHVGNPDKDLYLKWIKFAAFTPIMRPHCTNYVERFREPWNYDKKTLDISREYINMRYRLLGYLYSNAFENYMTGEPIFKSLSYEYPTNKKVRNNLDTYIYGKNILVSPLGGSISNNLLDSHYIKPVKATYYLGTNLEGEPIKKTTYSALNFIWNRVSPEKEVPIFDFSALFETRLKFNDDVLLSIKNDDGVKVYIDNKLVLNDWSSHGLQENKICELKANEEYDIKIEYYQGGGEAGIQLCYTLISDNIKRVQFPDNKWIDAFNGKIYKPNKKIIYKESSKKFPLYIKEGSLIPLLKAKNNTSELSYQDIILEYYPSKEVNDFGYIYEDDRRTIAYQDGIYRKTNYNSYYDSNDNSCNIVISKTNGLYKDDIKEREVLFKYHLINECDDVESVTINNQIVDYKLIEKDSKLYPFNEKEGSPISNVLVFKFKVDITKDYNIKVKLK